VSRNAARIHRIARVITEVFAPAVLVTLVLVTSPFTLPEVTAAQAAVAAFFVTLLPFSVVVLLTRRGKLSDIHIGTRTQRAPILAGTAVSIGIGLWVLTLMHAPPALHSLIYAVLLGLVISLLVNLVWKVSVHAAVAAILAAMLASVTLPLGILWAAIPLAVAWSRVQLLAHTWPQVIVGWVLGLVIFAVYITFLR
jgi:membrane-associated phospholipid phosphatase